jgi:glycosyltransferase involved in cell wall biosynthesis
MYLQVPVIAVNSGGPRETVVNDVTGFLCNQVPNRVICNPYCAHTSANSNNVCLCIDAHLISQDPAEFGAAMATLLERKENAASAKRGARSMGAVAKKHVQVRMRTQRVLRSTCFCCLKL